MLTYILKHNLAASVFSVPAIGNWMAPELAKFTSRLIGKTVYIVADADAYRNDAVMEQARLCRTYLQECGVRDAHAALPPRRTRRESKGVDDFLHNRGRLEDLEINDRELPSGWLNH